MKRPETRFAWNGNVSLGYQVIGDGPTTVGSDLAFEDRGLHTLKGVPGEWRVHAVARR